MNVEETRKCPKCGKNGAHMEKTVGVYIKYGQNQYGDWYLQGHTIAGVFRCPNCGEIFREMLYTQYYRDAI